eukprot:scaffold131019_cov48-Prasinocladus_malaysianus.AAC.1
MSSDETLEDTLPFALAYNQGAYSRKKLLAIGDEEGYLTIVDTSKQTLPEQSRLPSADSGKPGPCARWVAHNNAVFDLCWNKVAH